MKVLHSVLCCAVALVTGSTATCSTVAIAADGPIAIAELKHEGPVDFAKEVLPLLQKNCLACHNAQKSEGALILENPQAILKGGDSGPAVVAGKSAESLLLKAAAHQEEPHMPPAGNSAGAVDMNGGQLALIKQWIDEGATGEVKDAAIAWQPLPPGINPIYAVTLTPDAQFAACGRANQIFVYNVASGALVTRLTDPLLIKSGPYPTQGVAHLDLVQALAFSPDGSLLASGSYREVKLWRRPANVRNRELAGAGSVLATSPDGTLAATGDAAGVIKLWTLADGKELRTLAGHTAAVTAIKFLPGGARLVSGSADKTLRVWNVADGAAIAQLETPTPIAAVAVVAEGAQAATAGGDNSIRLWSLPAEAAGAIAPVAELAGSTQPVVALVASPTDKTQLISGGADGLIRFWNLTNNQQAREINHGAAVTALAVRGDGAQIASAGADNLVKLWIAADGKPWAPADKQTLAELKGDARSQFQVATFERAVAASTAKVADDKKAATDAEAKIITSSAAVTAATTAKEAAAKALTEKQAAVKAPTDAKAAVDKELADATEANKVAVDAAAKAKEAAEKDAANADLAKARDAAAAAAAEADKKVKEAEKKVTDAAAALAKATQEATTAEAANMAAEQALQAAVAGIKKSVTDVPLAEAALKNSEAALAKLQAETEAAKKVAAEADKPFRSLAYSADGTQLVAAGDNGLVRTWAADTGMPVDTFAGHQGPATAAAFAADGTVVSCAATGPAIVWNPAPQWTLERTIGGFETPATFIDRVTSLAFSHDGKLLATGGGEPSRSGQLKIFNTADGGLVREIPEAHSDTIFGLEFSPDDAFVASSAADRFVKVFNASTGAHVKSFEGHTHHVLDVTWQWDGKVLASCGADNVIKIWDFITGDQRRTTQPFGKEVTSLGFIGATSKMLSASGDKTVRLVNMDNGAYEKQFSGPNDFMYATATSADGRLAIGGGQESTLFVWQIDNGQLLRSLPAPKPDVNKPATPQTAGN